MKKHIKAPFNFVPLNEKIYFPDWENQISHDIPFSNGESGEIELELEAVTPIFVRNGHTQDDAKTKNENYISFSKGPDGKYFIPGTSVKGMIRNVLEIMSFGKMNLDSSVKYATREWDNQDIYDLKNIKEQNKVCCGYLVQQKDKVIIENHGIPYRINHKRLAELFSTKIFEEHFYENNKFKLNEPHEGLDPKSAKFKYHLLSKEKISQKNLKNIRFSSDNEFANDYQPRRIKFDNTGEIIGDIVFTGQPDPWTSDDREKRKGKKGKGKFYEFVFDKNIDVIHPKFCIDKLMLKQFKFFNKDSEDWNFWKAKFESGEKVPVFFRHNNASVKDFGLAFLYKIPFKYSPKELSNFAQKNFNQHKPDLSELIFGYTGFKHSLKSDKKISLKGRVQFSSFQVINVVEPLDEMKTTLGSPKASYYPLYIEQREGSGGKVPVRKKRQGRSEKNYFYYETYHNKDAKIAGWKRYPVKASAIPKPTNNESLDSKFQPLPQGTVFCGKIRFHNLKPIEIGALISAITFHGNYENLFHQIGMGKPQGFGKIRVKKIKTNTSQFRNFYLSVFENTMENHCGNKWLESVQLTELLTMASNVSQKLDDRQLDYMVMGMEPGENEFLLAKQNGEYLERFSALSHDSVFKPESITEKNKKEEDKRKKEIAEQLKYIIESDVSKLEKFIKQGKIQQSETLVINIEQQISGYELFIDSYDKFKVLKTELIRLKEYAQLLSMAEDYMKLNKWQQAKLFLIEQILPIIISEEDKSEIEKKIEYCKKMEGEALSFNSVIDLSLTIDKNKGKIQNYLHKKGKLKQIPKEDLTDFYNALNIWYNNDPKKDNREWQEFDFRRSFWQTLICRWIDEEKALEFYKSIIQ